MKAQFPQKIASWFNQTAKRRWVRRVTLSALGMFLLYLVIGFLGVPLVLRHVAISKMNDSLVGTLEVDKIRFNPFTWELRLENFRGKTIDGEVATRFERFVINFEPASVLAGEYQVKEVLLDRPHATLVLDSEGKLNLLDLFGLQNPDPDKQPSSFEWPSLAIENFSIREAGLELRIESFGQPFERNFQRISLTANDLRTHPEHDNPYQLSVTTARDEQLEIDGLLRFDPLSSNGSIKLTSLKLPSFTSFSSAASRGEIRDGTLDFSADYQFGPLRPDPKLGIREGQLVVQDFHMVNPQDDSLIHRASKLHLEGILIDVPERRIALERISLAGASLLLERNPGQAFRLFERPGSAAKSGAVESSTPVQAETPADQEPPVDDPDVRYVFSRASQQLKSFKSRQPSKPVSLKIDQMVVNDSTVRIRDRAVQPTARFELSDIELTAGPYLNTGNQSLNLDLDLKLKGNASGSLQAKGFILPSAPSQSSDLSLTARRLSLPSFQGYLTPAIGRPATSGRLDADLQYRLKNGQIDGRNELKISDLQFGPRVESSSAPRLPLDLAVAILKDRENVVSLNIPVKGESGDPSFSYRKLIASALRNTIEKVVTAPFSILGSLLPGDQEIQRDFVGFKEGRKDLTPQTRGMLDKLATILEARPGLALDLTPSYHPGEDPGALQERLYEEAVTSRMKKEGLSRKAAIEELHDELPGKQKAKGWFPSFNAQKKALRESFTCDEERLEQLAKARAETVRKHLVETHGIDSSRIRISKVERGKHRVDLGVETR